MTIVSVVQSLVQQVQFIGLLTSLAIKFPDKFRNFLNVLNLSNIDPLRIIGQTTVPMIDFRMLFIIVSILVPIGITIVMLLLFRKPYEVVWYFGVVFGVVVLAIGILGRELPSAGLESAKSVATTYIIVGASVVGSLLLIGLIVRKCCPSWGTTSVKNVDTVPPFKPFRTLLHFFVGCVFLIGGFIISGIIPTGVPELDFKANRTMSKYIQILAFVAVGVGGLFLLSFLLGLLSIGRRFMFMLRIWFRHNMLMLMLVVVSLSFIPCISYCLNTFLCARYTCPQGFKFNPYAYRPDYSYNTSVSLYCDPCDFQGECIWTPEELCPAFSGRRNWKHPDIPCDDEATKYFIAAAAVVLGVYALIVPYLYYQLINLQTTSIYYHAEVVGAPDSNQRRMWRKKVNVVIPAASSLYKSFDYRHRYYTLVTLLHRLAVTIILVVVAPYSNNAAAIVLAIHASVGIVLLAARPFLSKTEHVLNCCLAVCNVMNAGYAIYIWKKNEQPSEKTTLAFVIINGALPLLGAIIGMFGSRRAAKKAYTDEAHEPAANMEASIDDVARKNQNLEAQLDVAASRVVTRLFMFMGIFFFLALGAAVLGSMREDDPEFLIATNRWVRDKQYVLGDYEEWDDFSHDCCCMETLNPPKEFDLVERWVCPANSTMNVKLRVVEKGRVTTGNDDGLPIRAFCSKTFVSACHFVSGSKPQVQCDSSLNVTNRAVKYLW